MGISHDGKGEWEAVLNDGFLKAKNNDKMEFYLMWANHTHTAYIDYTESDKNNYYWKGQVDFDTFDEFTDHVVKDCFSRLNYYRIENKLL
ncbi:MAG: hypothetical protein SPJ03_00385 [Candidatus Cryptobacteroides sp.]|nr:hypothetical protein [Candidatus Cryptobacteroides sp.]